MRISTDLLWCLLRSNRPYFSGSQPAGCPRSAWDRRTCPPLWLSVSRSLCREIIHHWWHMLSIRGVQMHRQVRWRKVVQTAITRINSDTVRHGTLRLARFLKPNQKKKILFMRYFLFMPVFTGSQCRLQAIDGSWGFLLFFCFLGCCFFYLLISIHVNT